VSRVKASLAFALFYFVIVLLTNKQIFNSPHHTEHSFQGLKITLQVGWKIQSERLAFYTAPPLIKPKQCHHYQ